MNAHKRMLEERIAPVVPPWLELEYALLDEMDPRSNGQVKKWLNRLSKVMATDFPLVPAAA